MTKGPRATLVCLVTGAILLASVVLLPRFEIDPDIARMLPQDHPHVYLSERLDRQGGNRRSLFVVLRGPMTDLRVRQVADELSASEFVAEVAATRTELLGAAWSAAVAAPLWFLAEGRIAALEERLQPAGRRAALAETLETLAEDPIAGREVAARDPLGLRWLLADQADLGLPIQLREGSPHAIFADGEGALLRLLGEDTAMNPEFATALLADVEGRLAGTGCAFDLFGGYVIARADAARIRHDLIQSVLWSVVLVAGYLLFCMSSHRLAVLALVPVGLAAFCAMSLGSFLFGPLNPIAIAAAAVLLGLGVDFAIHFLIRFQELRQTLSPRQSLEQTHRALAMPLLVGMLTTAVAFLSFAFGEFRGLAGFGLLLSLGLGLAFAGTLFLLPLLLLRFAPDPVPPPRPSRIADVLNRFARRRRGRRNAVGILVLAAAAWAVVAGLGIRLRADPETMRPLGDPVNATRLRLEAELGMSLLPCFVLLDATLDGDAAAASLARLQDDGLLVVTAALGGATEERRARVAAFHRRTAGWLEGTLTDMDDLGFAADQFRPVLESLAARLDANAPTAGGERVELDGREWRSVLCYPAPGTMTPEGWDDLVSRLGNSLGDAARVYGTPALQRELERMLKFDLAKAIGLTALMAFGLMVFVSRSYRAGILALLPTFCGLGFTLALLAALDAPITLGNFIALPFLLGIAVDDGVHLIAQLREERPTSITSVAIVRTSVTTTLAFGSLITAQSPGIASLGWIIAVGVAVCLLTTLLVLPPLWSNRRP